MIILYHDGSGQIAREMAKVRCEARVERDQESATGVIGLRIRKIERSMDRKYRLAAAGGAQDHRMSVLGKAEDLLLHAVQLPERNPSD